MPDETQTLLFASDITANINVSDAKKALTNLRTQANNLAKDMSVKFKELSNALEPANTSITALANGFAALQEKLIETSSTVTTIEQAVSRLEESIRSKAGEPTILDQLAAVSDKVVAGFAGIEERVEAQTAAIKATSLSISALKGNITKLSGELKAELDTLKESFRNLRPIVDEAAQPIIGLKNSISDIGERIRTANSDIVALERTLGSFASTTGRVETALSGIPSLLQSAADASAKFGEYEYDLERWSNLASDVDTGLSDAVATIRSTRNEFKNLALELASNAAAISEGIVSANRLIHTFEPNKLLIAGYIESLDRAGEKLDEWLKKNQSVWEKTGDVISSWARDVYGHSILPEFADAVDENLVRRFDKAASGFQKIVREKIGAEQLAEGIGVIQTAITNINSAIASLGQDSEKIPLIVLGLAENGQKLGIGFEEARQSLIKSSEALAQVERFLTGAGAAVSEFTETSQRINEWSSATKDMQEGVKETARLIEEQGSVLNEYSRTVTSAMPSIDEIMPLQAVHEVIAGQDELLKGYAKGLEYVGNTLRVFVNNHETLWQQVIEPIRKACEEIFGHSLLQDLSRAMDEYLVRRMARIINDYNKIVGGKLELPVWVSAKELNKYLEWYRRLVGELNKEAAKLGDLLPDQGRTVEKVIEDMNAAIRAAARVDRPAIKVDIDILDALKDLVTGPAKNVIRQIEQTINKQLSKLKGGFTDLSNYINRTFVSIRTSLVDFGTLVATKIISPFSKLKWSLWSVYKDFQSFSDQITKIILPDIITKFETFSSGLAATIRDGVKLMGLTLENAFREFPGKLSAAINKNIIDPITARIRAVLSPALRGILDKLPLDIVFKVRESINQLSALATRVTDITKSVAAGIAQVFAPLRTGMQSAVAAIQVGASAIRTSMGGAFAALSGMASSAFSSIAQQANSLGSSIGTALSPITSQVSNIFNSAKNIAVDSFKTMANDSGAIALSAFSDLAMKISYPAYKMGQRFSWALGDAIKDNMVPVIDTVKDAFTQLGKDIVSDVIQAIYDIDNLLTGKSKVQKLLEKSAIATRQGQIDLAKALKREAAETETIIKPWMDSIDVMDHRLRVMRRGVRETFADFKTAVGDAISGHLSFRQAVGGMVIAARSLDEAMGLAPKNIQDSMQNIGKLRVEISRMFAEYDKSENVDKATKRMMAGLDDWANTLKNNQLTFNHVIRTQEEGLVKTKNSYRELTALADALGKQLPNAFAGSLDAIKSVREDIDKVNTKIIAVGGKPIIFDIRLVERYKIVEEAKKLWTNVQNALSQGGAFDPGLYDKLKDISTRFEQAAGDPRVFRELRASLKDVETQLLATGDATKGLERGGKAVVGLGKVMDSLVEKAKEYPKTVATGVGQMEATVRVFKDILPGVLRESGGALTKLVSDITHFYTTFEATGKISRDRMADVQRALREWERWQKEIAKYFPQMDESTRRYWEQINKNVEEYVRRLSGLVRHTLVLEKAKAGLATAFDRLGQSVKGLTKFVGGLAMQLLDIIRMIPGVNAAINAFASIASKIPVIGQHFAKLKKEAVPAAAGIKSLSQATSTFGGVQSNLLMQFSQLSPAFSEMNTEAANMSRAFTSGFQSMRQVAETGGPVILKTLTAIKIGAAAIIAAFGSLIISTGKLAAELTTLEMTMAVVAENTGYGTEKAEKWVEVLKDAGIMTIEATKAMTGFMRAQLPTTWKDPVTDATNSLQDLARVAQETAVTMGVNSSEMFERFLDFVQTGNSQLIKQAGIMKTAEMFYQEFAEAIGTTSDKLSTNAKRMALVTGLVREGAAITGVYDKAMETAAKQLGSMTRYWGELRLTWGKEFEPIIAAAVKALNNLIISLTRVEPAMKKKIATAIALTTAIAGLTLGLTVLLPKFTALFSVLKFGAGLIMSRFGLLLVPIGLVISSLSNMFMKIESAEDGIAGIVERLTKLFGMLGDKVKEIFSPESPMMKWITSFVWMVRYHLDSISVTLRTLFANLESIAERFKEKFAPLIEVFNSLKVVIGDLFAAIWHVVNRILYAVEAALTGDWEKVVGHIRSIAKIILALMLQFFNEVVVKAYEWGSKIIIGLVNGIIKMAKIAIPRAMTFVGTLISLFLRGHSPPKVGPLRNIDRWGVGIMSTFENALRRRGISFDDKMFFGISGMLNKAKAWGQNVTDVFAYGIASHASGSIVPAMDVLGELIARFLRGHSPPIEGTLSDIDKWGRSLLDTFVAAFGEADLSALDDVLRVIEERLKQLARGAENSASIISNAMRGIISVVNQAIANARATGGPLDLSGLQEILVGPLAEWAEEIREFLGIALDAYGQQIGLHDLYEKIKFNKEAQKRAAAVAETLLAAVKEQIYYLESQKKRLQAQMEAQVKAQLEAAGLVIDERLVKELKRQLEEANAAVSKAQKRLQNVQKSAGKYGENILTWEEINAQHQLELAERRKDEVQSQVDIQEQRQREADRIRDQIEAQYDQQIKLLDDQLKALKLQEESLAEFLRRVGDIKDSTKDLSDVLKDLKEKLEEEKGEVDIDLGLDDIFKDLEKSLTEVGKDLKIEPPDFSETFKKWEEQAEKIIADFEESLRTFFGEETLSGAAESAIKDMAGKVYDALKAKIEGIWEGFKQTPVGQFLTDIKFIEGFEVTIKEIGEIIDSIITMLQRLPEVVKAVTTALFGLPLALATLLGFKVGEIDWIKAFANLNEVLIGVVELGSELFQLFMQLISLDFDAMGETFREIGAALGKIVSPIAKLFGSKEKKLREGGKRTKPDLIKPEQPGMTSYLGMLAMPNIGGTIRAIADTIGNELLTGIGAKLTIVNDAVKGKIGEIIAGIAAKAIEFHMAAVGLGQSIYDGLVSGITTFWEGLKTIVTNAINSVIGWFKEKLGIASPSAVFMEIGIGIVTGLINGISSMVQGVIDLIVGLATSVYNAALGFGDKIYTGIKERVDSVIAVIASWFSGEEGILGKIKGTATDIYNGALALGENIYNGIKDKVSVLVTDVYNWIAGEEGVLGRLRGTATDIYNAAIEIGNNIYNGIKDKVQELVPAVAAWLTGEEGIAGKIRSAAIEVYNAALAIGQGIYDGIKEKVEGVLVAVKELLGIQSPSTFFASLGSDIIMGLINGLMASGSDVVGKIVGLFTGEGGIISKIKEVAGNIYNAALEIGLSIFNGIKTKVDEIINSISGWFFGGKSSVAGEITGAASKILTATLTTAHQMFVAFQTKITEILNNMVLWFTAVAFKLIDPVVMTTFYNNAYMLASQIYNAFWDRLFGEGGLGPSIVGWMNAIADSLVGKEGALEKWKVAGEALAKALTDAIEKGIKNAGPAIATVVKELWNNNLRKAFKDLLTQVIGALNVLIIRLNKWLDDIGQGGLKYPKIDGAPELPSLQKGGITTQNVIAQLHAGEVVMPLDRLIPVLQEAFSGPRRPSLYAPTIVIQGDGTRQAIAAATKQSLALYDEWLREG
jgi:DNA repair exonuclease SbcCD ATPase subunit